MDDRRAEYDPARLLTHAALIFVGILILFVSAIIGVQIVAKGEANTESWAALTGLIGWATSQVSVLFNNRFGNTKQSTAKDAVIAEQSRTAAVIAGATSGTAPTATIQTPSMTVESTNTTVNPKETP